MDAREVAEMLNVYLNANHVERFKPRMLRIRERLDDLVFGAADGGPNFAPALGSHPSPLAAASEAHSAAAHPATRPGPSSFNAAAAAPYPDPGLQAAGVHAGPHQPYGALPDVTANDLKLSQAKRQVETYFDSSTITQETGGLVPNPHSGQRFFASESQRTSLLAYIKARLKHDLSLHRRDTSLVKDIHWAEREWPDTNTRYRSLSRLYKVAHTRGTPATVLSNLVRRKERIFHIGDYTVELLRHQEPVEGQPWLVYSVMARTDTPTAVYKGIYLGDLGVPTAPLGLS
ncbi:hypothetical protein ACQY0O_001110 [Thecaphora frezii]